MFETIVALATAPMKAALHIIRVSGDDSFAIASKCFSKDITLVDKRTALIGEIVDDDKIIDQVVLLAYKGPKSFTGEDLVEIICHGSLLIANEIIQLLIKNGARPAQRGEFSMRSFLHQKIDLVQAEAINDLINASTKEAKNLSMMSLDGLTSELLYPLKKEIADLIALIEVNIDYPEYEDIEVANKEKIVKDVDKIINKISSLVDEGEKGRIVKEGIKVAIIGRPNVGKSSLLNTLLGEEKAIVTDIEGTTRDVVEGSVSLGGVVLHLLDTAGIRQSKDVIENIGVQKTKQSIKEADVVIVVLDSSKDLTKEDEQILKDTEHKTRIIIHNKADLLAKKDDDKLYVSALNKDVESLKNEIYKTLGLSDKTFTSPSLNNARQIGLLKQAIASLNKAKEDALNDLSVDLVSVSLMDSYSAILEILGEKNEMDISKEIFSRFCVGK